MRIKTGEENMEMYEICHQLELSEKDVEEDRIKDARKSLREIKEKFGLK